MMSNVKINKNDEYNTPEYAVYPLLEYLDDNSHIWCPFDKEDSAFVRVFKKHGHRISCNHISELGGNFFQLDTNPTIDYIISNPPYSQKYEVLKKLFEMNTPFAMLVGTAGLFESKKRFEMFKNNKFEVMYFDKRIAYINPETKLPEKSPPFGSVYICHDILPEQIMFKTLNKEDIPNKE